MVKIKRQPVNTRTIGLNVAGAHSAADEWPPRSYSGKYSLKACVATRVVEGEVYVEKYVPGKMPTTSRHHAGDTFVQDPGVDAVYAVGSVYGAKTVSFSKNSIDPIFLPEENDEDG
jgi:hypothetical protein